MPASEHHVPPPQELVRSPLSDGEWHRLHPLTPLLRGGLFLLVVVGIIVANLRDRLLYLFLPWLAPDADLDEFEEFEGAGDPIDFVIANNLYLLAVLAVLGVLLVLTAIFYLSWRFHTFRITGDDVEVRSGILFRTQRRAPLDRVQGVNLTRPMVARLLGMAKLEVVGAGADANVKLEYLSTANAEAVRADILRLASGRRLADAAARSGDPAARSSRVAALGHTVSRGITGLIEGDEAPAAVPDSVVNIPVGRLVASHIVSPTTVFLVLATIAVVVGVSQGVTWLLFGFVPALIGVAAYWVRSILRSLRYSIAPTPDGVRITFGLLTTVTEILPPGRIHAVEITQPILWRPAGWWLIRINRMSGRSATDSNTDQFTTVLPVGTAADVERVLRLVLPSVPEAEWPLIVQRGHVRSRDGRLLHDDSASRVDHPSAVVAAQRLPPDRRRPPAAARDRLAQARHPAAGAPAELRRPPGAHRPDAARRDRAGQRRLGSRCTRSSPRSTAIRHSASSRTSRAPPCAPPRVIVRIDGHRMPTPASTWMTGVSTAGPQSRPSPNSRRRDRPTVGRSASSDARRTPRASESSGQAASVR